MNKNTKDLRFKRKTMTLDELSERLGIERSGWSLEMNLTWVDAGKNYAVLGRELETEWGKVTHLAIRNAPGTDIGWREKQIIKNKIMGYNALAIEVYPPHDELINQANMYHLWVLHETKLPFTLLEKKKEPENEQPQG